MQDVKPYYSNPKTGLYHLLVWILLWYFWYRYFVVSDTRLMAAMLSFVTILFNMAAFYLTVYFLYPSLPKIKKELPRYLAAASFVLLVAFARTVSVLVLYRLMLPSHYILHFMGQLFISLFHISYVFIFAMALKLLEDRHLRQIMAEKELKERLQAELSFLKSQFHPHFLFNIHNNIYFLIHDKPAEAADTLLKLSGIMRYQLYECNDRLVPLKKELDNISSYIKLEKTRTGDKVKIEYDFPAHPDIQIPPFILMTLIENAFKHVSGPLNSHNFISAKAGITKDNFYFSVINSTAENPAAPVSTGAGTGLKNLFRRLELEYGKKYQLSLVNKENIFSVNLTLPLYATEMPDSR